MDMPRDPHDSIGVLNESVPNSEGPLIREKLSTKLIHEAYAGADPPDPTFTAKTASLIDSHPSFRAVRGDGSCGFRAIMFSYFEILINLTGTDPTPLKKERERIDGLTAMLHRSEYAPITWEEWVEATMDLFDAVIAAVPEGKPIAVLEQQFNDEGIAPALVQHFRMLTSCWMNEKGDLYKEFLPEGMSVDQYRQAHIDPASAEMEEMSLKCAYDLLLDGAGIVLEISYLDRSPGDKVNVHLYEPQEKPDNPDASKSAPTMRLLYRPGHYDILYPTERNETAA